MKHCGCYCIVKNFKIKEVVVKWRVTVKFDGSFGEAFFILANTIIWPEICWVAQTDVEVKLCLVSVPVFGLQAVLGWPGLHQPAVVAFPVVDSDWESFHSAADYRKRTIVTANHRRVDPNQRRDWRKAKKKTF